MTISSPPSLLGDIRDHRSISDVSFTPHSLMDLLYDGFYALFMLKNRCTPQDETTFSNKMQKFLNDFERNAKKLDASADDIHNAKYAFCAAVDEIILHSKFEIRDNWERHPLQLVMFGDQLAGENFFNRLETLRAKGSAHLQALEVFHMCLLLGFQGKYILEGPEKLNYLTARLGDEIAHMKNKRAPFAPFWERPDTIANKLRNEVPLWVICSVFALIALTGFIGLNWMLASSTEASINGYSNLIRLAPPAANLTITLP
ncbi:type IVB secretion system protein IcmH/DotU [Sulfurirhabdus autotrophica]|uniref:Type VI secretion system protein ImpK n=1 Tax=Sulfurirhabdus autotrophica TaxID=1706046 RepID=A0A4R3YJ10_9PROT|nr:type IVB secretion system protein IcmH/DotU [Sulfurirhabdus autotrophica]TCV90683.1 type VI secretion system protein ImpK [Sulfurirhabdus autotrophica]